MLIRATLRWLALAGLASTALISTGFAQSASDRDTKPAAAASGPGRLSIRGQEILDPSGKPILLRGWNWGRWGKAAASDAAENMQQGANVVRLPLRWWGYYKGKDVDARNDAATATAGIDPENLAMLDNTIRWAADAKMWIVLFIDSNCGQNGTQNREMVSYCDPKGQYRDGHNFWTDPAAKAKFFEVWRFIANRYKNQPYLGMFEPLPEPNPPAGSQADITAFYNELMNVIRPIAPGIPFLVGPDGYRAQGIASAYNPAWKDVVYTGNLFLHEKAGVGELKSRLQGILDLRSQRNVPIFVQQVGVRSREDPDQSQLKAVLSLLKQNRVGFAYWEYHGSNNPGEYGVKFQDRKQWVTKQPELQAITSFFKD